MKSIWNTDTILPPRLLGYLFENDSRVVPEKFEGEPAYHISPLHAHTQLQMHSTQVLLSDNKKKRKSQETQSLTSISYMTDSLPEVKVPPRVSLQSLWGDMKGLTQLLQF